MEIEGKNDGQDMKAEVMNVDTGYSSNSSRTTSYNVYIVGRSVL